MGALYRGAKIVGASAFLLVALFVSGAHSVHAASLDVLPAAGSYAVGSTFTVTLSAASELAPLNAVSGTLSFPANLLEVSGISKNQSMISLWVKDPSFSNTAGTIQFEGVVPNPGFIGTDGRILTVTFKVKAIGSAALNYSAGSILANDGDGTEILKTKSSAAYTLTPAVAGALQPVATSATSAVPAKAADGTGVPQVVSTTHPDGVWSHLTAGDFTFVVPSNVTALRLLADDKPTTIPTVVYAPAITNRHIKDLPEGISYLHVQYKTAAGWGQILHYKLQIDTTAPTTFTITEVAPGKFTFVSNDALSGILRYDIIIDGGVAIPFTDDGSHTFTAPTLTPGSHTLLVRALDAASNTTESTRTFTVAEPVVTAAPTPAPVTEDSLILSKGTFAITILSVITPLIALVLFLLWLLHLAWRTLGGIKRKIDREITEARAAVHKSFMVMRSEFELDVELLRKASVKRKLTREESKILKHLQSTIDTAETAISKEITDIENTNR
jgi:hypothetical protein